MAKGIYSQGVSFLTDGRTTVAEVKCALHAGDFEIVKETPSQTQHWQFGGPTLVIPYLPEVNGYALVDVVNQLWPDSMGDPKSDPITFGAWSMGHFGPLAYPGGLCAGQHAWGWQAGRTIAERHRGFIRIRMTYALGAKGDDPVFPKNYDALAEMRFLSRVALAVLEAPGVICYFNPNGEVLRDFASFREVWSACEKQEKIPLLLWANVRFYNLSDRLGFMDTIGNGQLDIQDIEAIYPSANYEPGDVDNYLRNVTHYLLGLG